MFMKSFVKTQNYLELFKMLHFEMALIFFLKTLCFKFKFNGKFKREK